jgi:enolase-phosphatase E1
MTKISYILTDLEGTTTSIHFVHEVLFPYFLRNIQQLAHLQDLEEVQAAFERVKLTAANEHRTALDTQGCIDLLRYWTETDRKEPDLKKLQGILWREGYEKGELKGHFYPDVVPALARWQSAGIRIGIYSSGSVAAQKLLVKYSEYGDLSAFFSDYFDTAVGHKRETLSYQNIQADLNIAAENILFLSDITEELDAAQAAGMQTIQLARSGTVANSSHRQVSDFEFEQ